MTVFLRLVEREDKSSALREAIVARNGAFRYEVAPESFQSIPRTPFAYWVSERIRRLFEELQPFENNERTAKQGLATADDFRFVRLWFEVSGATFGQRWFAFAKGGKFSPFQADVYLLVNWAYAGAEIRNNLNDRGSVRSNVWMLRDTVNLFFFRPGLTWPLRTTSGLSARVMPSGCVFGHKGPAAFVEGADTESLLAILAIFNSQSFQALVELQLAAADAAARSYEVGVVQRTPIPDLSSSSRDELAAFARSSCSIKRNLDTAVEASHAFVLPALLQAQGPDLSERAAAWDSRLQSAHDELSGIQQAIDELCFELYGIEGEDRRQIEIGFDTTTEGAESEDDDEDAEPEEADSGPLVESLLSWAVGVAFGRFDVRLATQDRKPPPEPEPFDPLPPCSPGTLTGDDGLPVQVPPPVYPLDFPSDGILADDTGHDRDLVARMRHVFELVFGDQADAVWREAAEILDARTRDVRGWVARSFFERHIKRYSKSRRKAPIYWQLSTPSASYSVWLYLHRFTKDTLYKVLNDFAEPKLRHEQRKLATLTQEAGGNPTSSQRKELDAQERFVEELRSFRDEVARIAPLWNPNLDDGVIINFAPLWRLVPQHRGWQKECRNVWDKLCKGEYDWAHLAMHLWPERVVPKCRKDRSLAIAHGLEDVFWEETSDGKWNQRKADPATVDRLIEERTSAAVRDARQNLLDAPAPAIGGSRARSCRTTKGRRSKERSKGREA
jgi:hypothetical protein